MNDWIGIIVYDQNPITHVLVRILPHSGYYSVNFSLFLNIIFINIKPCEIITFTGLLSYLNYLLKNFFYQDLLFHNIIYRCTECLNCVRDCNFVDVETTVVARCGLFGVNAHECCDTALLLNASHHVRVVLAAAAAVAVVLVNLQANFF